MDEVKEDINKKVSVSNEEELAAQMMISRLWRLTPMVFAVVVVLIWLIGYGIYYLFL